jgi:energy-coupling factor transporter ATP-binding protein EcfA2
MRFRDRPLLVDGLDTALYVARPDLERRLLAPLLQDRNVLLLGEAGSGKSTLLRKSIAVLESQDRPAVPVSAALARDAHELLSLVDVALRERLGDREQDRAAVPISSGRGLLADVRRLPRSVPAVILVDGLLDPEVGYDVFGRLRDELWALGHAWALAIRPRDSATLRTPPADAFWGAVVEIPPLNHEETERLLRLGLDDHEYHQVDRDRSIAGAHPRSVIRDAQALLDRDAGAAGPSMGPELSRRASLLGRSEGMAMAELQGIGRLVSAHDPELLERLGWSRAYAQRILSHLEAARLVRSIPERSDRPGRPRKLYEPNPDPDGEPEWE